MDEFDPKQLAADIFAKGESGAPPVDDGTGAPPPGAEASDKTDAELAASSAMMDALEKKDPAAYLSAFKAALEICYPELVASKPEGEIGGF